MTNKAETLAKASKDLMLKEPFYGLFLIGLNKKWSEKIPTACVSLNRINVELSINPDFWNSKPAAHQIGVLKHELLHIAFHHLMEFRHLLEEDHYIANVAMDMEINQYIDKSMLWEDPEPILPKCYPELDLDLKAGTHYYYDKLRTAQAANNKTLDDMIQAMKDGKTSFTMPDSSEVELPQHDWKEITDLDESTQKLVEAQVRHVLNQVAEQVEKSRGTIPGEMEELLKRLNYLEPPKFDWKGFMRRFTGKSVKVYTKKTRRKFNKRLPDFPGLKIKQQKHILAGIDTSASVNDDELLEFFNEIHHMYKTGSEVTICQCDTAIKKLESFNPKADYKIAGRGGTDFQPVIDYFNENQHKYSCLIYLTDGEAPAPDNAKGNILWVLSNQSEMNTDLPGSVIQLN